MLAHPSCSKTSLDIGYTHYRNLFQLVKVRQIFNNVLNDSLVIRVVERVLGVDLDVHNR